MNDCNVKRKKDYIKQSPIFGNIKNGAKSWDDRDTFGEDFLLKSKIIRINIYECFYNGFEAISGITLKFKNMINSEIKEIEHKGNIEHFNTKSKSLDKNDYFVNFHLRIPFFEGYISELGFSTNKKDKLIVGKEIGTNIIIKSNGGENIILGTYGYFGDKLDAIGIYYIKKIDYLGVKLYGYFLVRYLIKKNTNFKEKWNNRYKDLQRVYQYLWKTLNLPDNIFYRIMKYLII